MLFRLVQRVPNPLTLPQWVLLLRIAALLSLFMALFGLFFIPANVLSGMMTLTLTWSILAHFLNTVLWGSLLYAAADLIDDLAGRRDGLRLGRHISVLLQVKAGVHALSGIIPLLRFPWLHPQSGLSAISQCLMSFSWALFCAAAGMIARLLTGALIQSREHAIPRDGRLPYALRRLAAVPRPLGRMLPAALPVGAGLLLLLGTSAALLDFPQYFSGGVPPFTGSSGLAFAGAGNRLLSYLDSCVVLAFLLLGLAAWAESRFTGTAPPRLAGILPFLLGMTVVLKLASAVLMQVTFGGGALMVFLNLLGDSRLTGFAGAGFAVRHISWMLQAARDEEAGLQAAPSDAAYPVTG